ncbi:asparaginase [Candidatus Woesearchaeota archaeon]|nr:asparaginase [Candidatus Woesearchaeota archaeon]
MSIKILVTGGTFDKEYNELDGTLFFKETHLDSMLKTARAKLDVKIRTVMLIDSLDMTDSDRKLILETCKKSIEDKILITHGTDTMVETAQILGKNIVDKTIVLTGAMVPYIFRSSDGLFNLGCALAFVQSLPNGVYISMNGKYFHWDNVKKIKEIGEFKTIK